MQLIRFDNGRGPRNGILTSNGVIDINDASPSIAEAVAPGDMTALLALGEEGLAQLRSLTEVSNTLIPLAKVRLLAPTHNPPKMLCAWVNYLREGASPPAKQPIFFAKLPSAIIGTGDNIVLPACCENVVAEPELTAVIGKAGRYIAREKALEHVAGFTIVNDVTSFNHRLVDLLGTRGPNMMAKVFDTFAPSGPAIVTLDEIGNPENLRVKMWVNNVLKIDGTTSSAITGVADFISYLSEYVTLQPGDLIITGSPPLLKNEIEFLAPGDAVKINIEGIGTLENHVVSEAKAQQPVR